MSHMRLKNHYFILRHGDTVWTKTGRSYPWPDSPRVKLTLKARTQIKGIAEKLKKKNIELIFAPDLFRTKQTAKIVAKELGLKIHFEQRLRDSYIGGYHGQPKEIFNHDFPLSKLTARFKKRPKGGENWNDVRRRIKGFLTEIEKEYRDKKILIVSHGDPLWLLEGLMNNRSDKNLVNAILSQKYIKMGELRKIN